MCGYNWSYRNIRWATTPEVYKWGSNEAKQRRGICQSVWIRLWLMRNCCVLKYLPNRTSLAEGDSPLVWLLVWSTFSVIWKIFIILTSSQWISSPSINKGKNLKWVTWRVWNWVFMKHTHLFNGILTWIEQHYLPWFLLCFKLHFSLSSLPQMCPGKHEVMGRMKTQLADTTFEVFAKSLL